MRQETDEKRDIIGISAIARMAACAVLILSPIRVAAEDILPAQALEEERARLETQRAGISAEVMKAEERARRRRQRALNEAKDKPEPLGLLIASSPRAGGAELYTIQAEEVTLGSVLICLARKARFELVINSSVGRELLDEPVTTDLRLVVLDDALDVLSGMAGLRYRTGREEGRPTQVLIFRDDLTGDDAPDILRRNAVDMYTRLLLKYPSDDLALEAYFRIAEIHFDQKEYALAAQDYKALLNRDIERKFAPRALVKLGLCYSMLGDYPSASKALYGFLDRAPGPAAACKALLALAGAATRAGDTSEAFRAYRRLLLEYPSSQEATPALHGLAELLFDRKEYQSALRQYELLRKRQPGYKARSVCYKIAMCKMMLERWSAASADFAKLLAANDQDAIASECYYAIAKCLDNGGGRLEAVEAYTGAAERFPGSADAPKARARVIELYRELGLLDKAIAYGEGSLKLIPPGSASEHPVKYQLAAALFDAGEFDRAMVLFEELAQAPGEMPQADTLAYAGDAARKLGKFERAEVLYRAALKAAPDKARRQRALLGLGDSYLAQGEYKKAALAYQGIDPSEKTQ